MLDNYIACRWRPQRATSRRGVDEAGSVVPAFPGRAAPQGVREGAAIHARVPHKPAPDSFRNANPLNTMGQWSG